MMEQYKIYEREYNLEIYDKELLEKYGLEKKKFVYVGYTKQSLADRSRQWKWEIKHNRSIDKRIVEFINKLKMFYLNETDYKANVIEYLLFYNASVIDVAIDETQARAKEKIYTGRYYLLSTLERQYILLSDRDSYFKLKLEKDNTYTLKIKY